MTITKERFEQGLTYQAYKAQMTRNQERLLDNERAAAFHGDEAAFFSQLPSTINVVVVTEDWCGDAIAALPVVGKLADECGKLNLRIFLRDQNLDIMDQYLKEGLYRSIPVFVFFDQDFNELGHFIERPASVTEKLGALRQNLWETDPLFADIAPDTDFGDLPQPALNRLIEAIGAYRQANRDSINADIVREIRGLIEGVAAS